MRILCGTIADHGRCYKLQLPAEAGQWSTMPNAFSVVVVESKGWTSGRHPRNSEANKVITVRARSEQSKWNASTQGEARLTEVINVGNRLASTRERGVQQKGKLSLKRKTERMNVLTLLLHRASEEQND